MLVTRLFKLLAIIAVIPLLAGTAVRAQESRPVTTKELVERAQKIVLGDVVAQHSAWDDQGREIYTYTTLRIQRIIKSERADTTVVIRQLGGKVGAIESQVSGAPRFAAGERVLVMLGPYAGTPYYDLIDWREGKYVIKSDANRQEILAGYGPGHGQRVEEFIVTLRRYL